MESIKIFFFPPVCFVSALVGHRTVFLLVFVNTAAKWTRECFSSEICKKKPKSSKQVLIDLSVYLHVLMNLPQAWMRGEIITLLSPSYAWIRGRARYQRAFKVTFEKQIRAGARSDSLRFGIGTNHKNTPSLLIPCMYSRDLLSASVHSTSEIHKAHSQSH